MPSLQRRAARTALGLVALLVEACTYGPPEQRVGIEQIVRLGDSYRALVTIHYERFRRPTGLSAFPDGGRSRVSERRATVYLVDASDRTASSLTVQAAPDSLWEAFSAGVRGLEGDTAAYFQMTGCPRDGECYPELSNTVTLRVSTEGDVRAVPDVPAEAPLPGVMLARRQGEERYVRFSTDGGFVTARFEEDGPFEPLYEARADGSLATVGGQRP